MALESVRAREPGARLRAFVSATGSAGTLAAGDLLKERHGSMTVAVEALECPTMLYNGYGEHNIQGIGDKHIPLIHNVTNTDVVTAVSDRATDRLGVLFNTPPGRRHLASRNVPKDILDGLSSFGLSSICNVVASIKVAKHFGLGPGDVVATVATDGFAMYGSERDKAVTAYYPDGFDEAAAGRTFAEHILEATCSNSRRPIETGSSTSATSPGWSSRGSRWRTSNAGAPSRSGAASVTSSPCGTE